MPGESAGDPTTLVRFRKLIVLGGFDSLLLMEGSNDLANRDSRSIPPAIANLRAMLDDAKSRAMRPFLATVPPMVPGGPRGLAWSLVPMIDDQIRQLAMSESVPLVDVYAGFGDSFQQYIGPDGLHPNAAGYAKIADLFFAALKSTLETLPAATSTRANALPFVQRPRR
jgi:lysophospholipase L1-like esterase